MSGLDENRLYVVDINVEKNQVVVGPKEALNVDEIYLKDMNWINNTSSSEENIFVKVRNTGNLIKAKLSISGLRLFGELPDQLEHALPVPQHLSRLV